MSGWIKVHRDVTEHPVFKGQPVRLGVFVWLLCNVAWKPTRIDVQGKTVDVERGQICISLRKLAEQCGVTLKVVRSVLERLKMDTVVGTETVNGRTLITICNYDKYQTADDTSGTAEGTEKGTRGAQQGHIKEEGKKVKNSPNGERARGARLPDDWSLPMDWGRWALGEGWPEDVIRTEADKFRDHWISATGQSATKRDWLAAWRNWMRRVPKQPRKEVSHGRPQHRHSSEGVFAALREWDEAEGDGRLDASGDGVRAAAEPGEARPGGDGDVVPLLAGRRSGR